MEKGDSSDVVYGLSGIEEKDADTPTVVGTIIYGHGKLCGNVDFTLNIYRRIVILADV